MKIIFANKTPNFYERGKDFYSYFSLDINTGIVDTSQATILANINNKMNTLFPDYTTVTNKFNFNMTDFSNYEITISPKDYPDNFYPNTYDFWNNVTYVKFDFEEQRPLYFNIISRQNLNLPENKWRFKLKLDIHQSYWDLVYKNSKSKFTNRLVKVIRWHKDRFTFDTPTDKANFNFLDSQNEFWNKEQFHETIKSKIVIDSNKTKTPWTEINNKIIKNNEILSSIYELNSNTEINTSTIYKNGQNGYLLAFINHTDKDTNKPWDILDQFSGVSNTYWIIPLINKLILKTNNEIKDDEDILITNFDMKNGERLHYKYTGNIYDTIINVPNLSSLVLCAKPTFPFRAVTSEGPLFTPNYKWVDMAYPIRYRDKYLPNFINYIFHTDYDFINTKVNLPNTIASENLLDTVVLSNTAITNNNNNNLNVPNNTLSYVNSLSDERIDFTNHRNKLYFDDFSNNKNIQPININFEPQLFTEEFFNVEYTRYNDTSLIISPRWYFFDNVIDLKSSGVSTSPNTSSIYLLGYQFVQPHIVILTQGVVSGLYKYSNLNAKNNLTTIFSAQQQTVSDKQIDFLTANRSEMNTGLNIQRRNADTERARQLSNIGNYINPLNWTQLPFNISKPDMDYKQAVQMYNSKLDDLANTPNNTNDFSSDSTFKNLNAYESMYKVNWISEIDKQKIFAYHLKQGYYCDKYIEISELITRMWYDYWEIHDFKQLLIDTNLPSEVINYYQNMFDIGIRLWHDNSNGIPIDIGNYNLENWEIGLLNYLTLGGLTFIVDDTEFLDIEPQVIYVPDDYTFTIETDETTYLEFTVTPS